MELSRTELQRYARHLNLPRFGLAQQVKLKASKVLVIGAGGLGCPILQYLAAAGVGKIGIVDPDTIDRSNLHRQVLYSEADLGLYKAKVAALKIQAINPHTEVDCFTFALDHENALELFESYDLILDGTDNFPARYLINDACVLTGKTLVQGAVSQFEGQIAVFNRLREDGTRGPNYRHLFPTPPPPESVPNCAEAGVLGVLPGIIGSLQAVEAIKVILDYEVALDGKLMLFDGLSMQSRTIKIPPVPIEPITKLLTYQQYCGDQYQEVPAENWWTSEQLKAQLSSATPPLLIDIRETAEHAFSNIGGQHIPKKQFLNEFDIPVNQDIILYCKSGQRCSIIWNALKEQSRKRVFILEGGLLAWAKTFQPEMEVL